MNRQKSEAGRREERGQALVEIALLAVVLLLLLGFALDVGRAYYSYLALKDAAGEGAYFGSVYPTWTDAAACANPNNITFRVRNAAPSGGLVNLQNAAVSVTSDGTTSGSLITVTVTSNFQLLAPFTPIFVGGQTLPLTAVSSARILSPATPCG